MLLSRLAQAIGAELVGSEAEFSRVSTDTRTIQPGDFFVALQGENFDGHDYLAQAAEAGAVGVMVSTPQKLSVSQVVVPDTRIGLGKLAKTWLQQFSPKKVAITGSCGKTTVKEMVAAILSQQAPTLATRGNFNNDIGVPLTLCRLNQEHEFAVIEMGANHLGEIAYTVGLVEPDVALVNNVGSAHLEGFGSLSNVAAAKSEIYQGLSQTGVAVINLDDAYSELFKAKSAHCRQISFSMASTEADIHLLSAAVNQAGQYRFEAALPSGQISVALPLIGKHNVSNALAAITIAHVLGCSTQTMQDGLQSMRAVPGRLRVVDELKGIHVIDDTYNANPGSMRSAIDVLADLGSETCLVMGGMGELGEDSERLHREVGAYAGQKGIATVYGLGESANSYRTGFLEHSERGVFVTTVSHQQLAAELIANQQGKTILIKGSRSSAMEKVIQYMIENEAIVGSVN